MSHLRFLATLAALLAVAWATQPPTYSGYNRIWQQAFLESAGPLTGSSNWNIVTGDLNYNNEYQRYSTSSSNLRYSGSGTLQLIPRRDSTAPNGWTSARIESKYAFTPAAGKITRLESSLRLAGNPQSHKQGLWPAFWMLGDSYRKGTVAWPGCGEIDIMESVNGLPVGYAAVHCDKSPGGICNENNGISSSTTLPDNKFHVWRVEFNRKSTSYKDQSITWYMDGTKFHSVTGTKVGNATVWASLCQSPLYVILNVAVGGNWPGAPNANTWGGTGSMMEVNYVAQYVSV